MSEKNPRYVEQGRIGARKRWGPPRLVRLDALTPEQRDVVLALVAAQKVALNAEAERRSPDDGATGLA